MEDPITKGPLVSVLICARNEAAQLAINLPLVLKQVYRPFEVVLVDDQSTDHTSKIINELSLQFPHLKHICIEKTALGKKAALQTAIAKATSEYLIVTDADCRPSSNRWLGHMVSPFVHGRNLVLGVAPFNKSSGLLNAFARYEGMLTYLLYGSFTLLKKPFMGVGRNMAYTRSLASHYTSDKHRHLIGGDDDLLVNSTKEVGKSWLVTSEDALMFSNTPQTWIQFLKQKRRHVSVSWQYEQMDKAYLMLFAASWWIQLIGILVLLVLGCQLWSIGLYIVRMAFVLSATNGLKKYATFRLGLWLPLTDFTLIFYYPLIALFLLIKAPDKW